MCTWKKKLQNRSRSRGHRPAIETTKLATGGKKREKIKRKSHGDRGEQERGENAAFHQRVFHFAFEKFLLSLLLLLVPSSQTTFRSREFSSVDDDAPCSQLFLSCFSMSLCFLVNKRERHSFSQFNFLVHFHFDFLYLSQRNC